MLFYSFLHITQQPGGVLQKEGVLKNPAKFTWKHLWWSLFLKKLQTIKKRIQCRCLPGNFAKFLKTTLLYSICKRPTLKTENYLELVNQVNDNISGCYFACMFSSLLPKKVLDFFTNFLLFVLFIRK